MAFVQNFTKTNVDSVEEKIGFKLPFTLDNTHQSKTTFEALKTNLENLVTTQKGERLFQPNLGVDLKRHLFNPMTSESLISLQDDIIEQIGIWLPFIEVINVQTDLKPDSNTINVLIEFKLKTSDVSQTAESVQININTGATY